MLLVGASNAVSPDHHIIMDFAGFSIDTIFEGYKQVKINKTCAASALNSELTSFKFHLPADLVQPQIT